MTLESAGGIKNHSKVLELLYQLDLLTFLFVWRRHDMI